MLDMRQYSAILVSGPWRRQRQPGCVAHACPQHVDRDNQEITVQAGASVADIQRCLEEHGLGLPDFMALWVWRARRAGRHRRVRAAQYPHAQVATIGGVIASGSHGSGLHQRNLG